MEIKKVSKILKPLKVCMYGPSGSGKTMGALYTAAGIVATKRNLKDIKEAYKHILLIDTESGRGSLYAGLGEYNYTAIDSPFTTEKLLGIIYDAEQLKDIDVIIIDSLTHFWSKKGGILEQKRDKDALGGNSYTNWQDFTFKFNNCLDAILSSPKTVIVTVRAKTGVAMVTDPISGKTAPKTYGLTPEMRDGIEYEFDVTINIDKDTHKLIIEKGMVGMDTSYDAITPDFGSYIYTMATDGAVNVPRDKGTIIENIRTLSKQFNKIQFVSLKLNSIKPGTKLDDLDNEALNNLEKELIVEVRKAQLIKR